MSLLLAAGAAAPPADLSADDWPWGFEAEEDQWPDLLESGPVVADVAVVASQPPEDAWNWTADDVDLVVIPGGYAQPYISETPLGDDDEFPWWDNTDDAWWDYLNSNDGRDNAVFDAATDHDWDWDDALEPGFFPGARQQQDAPNQPTDAGIDEDAADDAWPDFLAEQIGADAVADQPPEAAWLEEEVDDWAPENDQIGADAINALPDDAWLWIDEVEDQAPADDGVGADAVFDQPTQDEWDWSGEVDDDFLESPVIDDGAMPAELSVDEEPVEDWWPEADPIGADALVDLASAEAWEWALEQEDDQRVEDEPIGADEPPLFVDAWPWGSADDTDDWWPEEAVIGPDEPPLFVDGWPWESADDTDDPPPPDEPIGADEPPLFVDGWYWDEEPAGNDDWWAECPYILEDRQESLTYTQDWDWVEDDTSDDDWWQWREEPQFDNVDLCPIFLAEAMARIAELEALLAAERGKSGGGGGEGEDYFRTRYRWATRDERIRRNNALILALVGAVVHGLDKPEEPTK